MASPSTYVAERVTGRALTKAMGDMFERWEAEVDLRGRIVRNKGLRKERRVAEMWSTRRKGSGSS